MDNNQITNPKVEVENGLSLNEKDYADELLSGLKAMVKNYAVALTEVSNEILYQKYKTMFDSLISLQRDTYEMMFRFGWYPMEKVEMQKVSRKHQMLTQELSNLN